MTVTERAPAPPEADVLTVHFVCECSEDVGLCGTVIDDFEWADDDDDVNCIVCWDLVALGYCLLCDREWE